MKYGEHQRGYDGWEGEGRMKEDQRRKRGEGRKKIMIKKYIYCWIEYRGGNKKKIKKR